MQNHFNLIDEAWIPVADKGLVSLKTLFSTPEIKALGGNPLQKISVTRLLLAIAQAAATPADDKAWQALGPEGLAASCLAYLNQWHHRFYLYGDNPFLQMPAIRGAANKSFGVLLPEVCTGNTSLLTETQKEKALNDADRALALISQMSVALGGKKNR